MQIYHVETQEDYDALMVELESEGCLWSSLKKPTDGESRWIKYEEGFYICVEDKKITYSDGKWIKKRYPDTPIQKYKANDTVNSPKHYTQGELEVIDILEDKLTTQEFEGFLKGNILKYTFREGIKNGTEDMKKGAWYMARLIEFRKGKAEHES